MLGKEQKYSIVRFMIGRQVGKGKKSGSLKMPLHTRKEQRFLDNCVRVLGRWRLDVARADYHGEIGVDGDVPRTRYE